MRKIFCLSLILMLILPCGLAENVVRKEVSIVLTDAVRTGYYTGSLDVDGLPDGYGVFEAVNSFNVPWRYVGEWEHGKMSGSGFAAWDDGVIEIGSYSENNFNSGKYFSSSISAEKPEDMNMYDFFCAVIDTSKMHIWECEQWQEVEVPQGVWIVGEDIPAGKWTVKCGGETGYVIISWGEFLEDNEEDIRPRGRYSTGNWVYNKSWYLYKKGQMTEYTFTVKDFDYIVIRNGLAVFTPFVSNPDLGFK